MMQLPIGAIIVSAFALLWTAAGASKMGSRWLVFLVASALTISVATVFAAATVKGLQTEIVPVEMRWREPVAVRAATIQFEGSPAALLRVAPVTIAA